MRVEPIPRVYDEYIPPVFDLVRLFVALEAAWEILQVLFRAMRFPEWR
jgi:hypothetical protein